MELEDLKGEMIVCALCGSCVVDCPSRRVKTFDSYSSRGRIILSELLMRERIRPTPELVDRVYTCTTCKRCNETCTAHVKVYEINEATRAKMVGLGQPPPAPYIQLADNIEKVGNVVGESQSVRTRLAETLLPRQRAGADTLFWAGCMTSYRFNDVAQAAAGIMREADYEFTMLGGEETCCGDPYLAIGYRNRFEDMAKKNLALFNERGIKRVVTGCPMCAKAFKLDYPEHLGPLDLEVLHISELLSQLIDEGRINLVNEVPLNATYFDPCHLGRHMNVFDQPRTVLRAIPGLELGEIPEYNRANSWCCGGAVRIAYTDLAVKISETVTDMAGKAGYEAIVTACPQCLHSLRFATFDLRVYDIAEIVAASMGVQELGTGFIE